MSISESESEPSLQSQSSDDATTSYSTEGSDRKPPRYPAVVQNWWLNETLGSGYSGPS